MSKYIPIYQMSYESNHASSFLRFEICSCIFQILMHNRGFLLFQTQFSFLQPLIRWNKFILILKCLLSLKKCALTLWVIVVMNDIVHFICFCQVRNQMIRKFLYIFLEIIWDFFNCNIKRLREFFLISIIVFS